MKPFHRFSLLCSLLLFPLAALGQTDRLAGVQTMQTYWPSRSSVGTQNWAITRDAQGNILVGSDIGLSIYDGARWRVLEVANLTAVRSLCRAPDKRVCYGASTDFGYLDRDSLGGPALVSLLPLLPESDRSFGEVFDCLAFADEVVYVASDRYFVHVGDSVRVFRQRLAPQYGFAFQDKAFAFADSAGLYHLGADGPRLVEGSEGFSTWDKGRLLALPYDSQRLLVMSSSGGFYLFDMQLPERGFVPFAHEAQEYLGRFKLYEATQVDRDRYALATLFGGVLLMDRQGNVSQVFREEFGLSNNTVTSLWRDGHGNLWLGTLKGLTQVMLSSPVSWINARFGFESNPISTIEHQGRRYLGTLEGIFRMRWDSAARLESRLGFERLGPERVSGWDFRVMDGSLLVGTNQGLAQVVGDELRVVHESDVVYRLAESHQMPGYLFLGQRDGLRALRVLNPERVSGESLRVELAQDFPELGESVRVIEVDREGNIWLNTRSFSVLVLRFEGASPQSYRMSRLGLAQGLPSDHGNTLFNLGDAILVLSGRQLFQAVRLPDGQFGFVPETRFTSLAQRQGFQLDKLYKDNQGNIWVLTPDDLGMLGTTADGRDSVFFGQYRSIRAVHYHKQEMDAKGNIFGHTEEQIFLFNAEMESRPALDLRTHFSEIRVRGDSVLFEGYAWPPKRYDGREGFVLQTELNNLEVRAGLAFFQMEGLTQYRFRLEGIEQDWSAWTSNNLRQLSNLEPGRYRLWAQARTATGQLAVPASFNFMILTPWYRTSFFFTFLFILAGLLVALSIRFYSNRLRRQNRKLEYTILDRTREILNKNEEIEKQRDDLLQLNHEMGQQTEEIQAQADSLKAANERVRRKNKEVLAQKAELHRVIQNVQMLSDLGRKIISSLSPPVIAETVYESINRIMDASVFAIGIFNPVKAVLEFSGARENGKELEYFEIGVEEQGRLAIWCFNHNRHVLINDFERQHSQYLPIAYRAVVGEDTQSVIYLPLHNKQHRAGVLTVQSFQKNAYDQRHFNLVEHLAVYVSIALENAQTYQRIETQNEELTHKNDLINGQNREIKDSIQYASFIQRAVLPPEALFASLFRDHMIFWLPRDIVSGDFFWCQRIGRQIVLVVADCTGHGVPGAMMSVMGVSFLNEVVSSGKKLDAAEILEELRRKVKVSLRQTGAEGEQQDGMDMALCLIDTTSLVLQFAGANNPLLLIRETERDPYASIGGLSEKMARRNHAFDQKYLYVLPADKMPIGIYRQEKPFTKHEVQLFPSDRLYLFTDGFIDQFGGPDGRKFLSGNFKQLLLSLSSLPLSAQRESMARVFDEWRGQYEQVDDVLVVGIQV